RFRLLLRGTRFAFVSPRSSQIGQKRRRERIIAWVLEIGCAATQRATNKRIKANADGIDRAACPCAMRPCGLRMLSVGFFGLAR
ncbi:MAG: hypothetical protein ACXU9H_01495, partial [Candidatus Binataceae bacterium]